MQMVVRQEKYTDRHKNDQKPADDWKIEKINMREPNQNFVKRPKYAVQRARGVL